MRYNLLYIVPQTILVNRRWNYERNFIVWNMQIWRNWQTRTVQQMISTNRNCSYGAIALGKSVAADLLRFADKSAHKVRSCMSVCFIKCELESRYLHHLRLRMKYSWLLYRLYNIYGGFYSPIDIIEP